MESKANILIFYRTYMPKCQFSYSIFGYIFRPVIFSMSPGSYWNSRNTCPKLTNLIQFFFLFASQLHCLDSPLCQSARDQEDQKASTHVFEDSAAGGLAHCHRCTSPDSCHAAVTVVEMQFQETTTENGLILDVCQDVRGEVTWLIMTLEQLINGSLPE